MSYFNRIKQHAVIQVLKQEEAAKKVSLLKADSEPMMASQQAQDASTQAYQSSYTAPPPVQDQIKAHKAAANLHMLAAKGHRASGKAVMEATPTVGAAHFQQAQAHDQSAQSHGFQAQNMQDAQDCGYR